MGDGYLISEKLQKRRDFRGSRYCTIDEPIDYQILKELARARSTGKKSLEEICRNIKDLNLLREIAQKLAEQREEQKKTELQKQKEALKDYQDDKSYDVLDQLSSGAEVDEVAEKIKNDTTLLELDEAIKSLEKVEHITKKDVEQTLKNFEEKGYIGIEKGMLKITSKGSNILAKSILREITENFKKKEIGIHETPENTRYGSKVTSFTRPHEIGDDYELLAIEDTLMKSLERNPNRITLEQRDFRVYKSIHQSKMCAGLLIDKSGSMKDNERINAAIETALAFSELLRVNPTDTLKVFTFSDDVEEIKPSDIVNIDCKGWTDIRSAMKAFRKAVVGEEGDKHVYLITDTEPNYEGGERIGFEKASVGVLEEALHYRDAQITLNIIMLSWTPHLKDFASTLAKKNLGRVFFTTPYSLGEIILEDYLTNKKGVV